MNYAKAIKGGFTAEPIFSGDDIRGFSVFLCGKFVAEFGFVSHGITFFENLDDHRTEWIREFRAFAQSIHHSDRAEWWDGFDAMSYNALYKTV